MKTHKASQDAATEGILSARERKHMQIRRDPNFLGSAPRALSQLQRMSFVFGVGTAKIQVRYTGLGSQGARKVSQGSFISPLVNQEKLAICAFSISNVKLIWTASLGH